ncbi:hypothetical protein ACJMK2_029027, partial [Sinanodonta woodiana]
AHTAILTLCTCRNMQWHYSLPLNLILQQKIQKLKDRVLYLKTSIDFEQTSHISRCIGPPEDILYHAATLGTISKKYDITYLVVDEAHCILEWG